LQRRGGNRGEKRRR